MMSVFVAIYILAVNIVTFILFGVDKRRARRHQWRIPEAVLLSLAVAGGSLGALAGMECWHHKTMHRKFSVGIPVILCLQLAALFYILMTSTQ